MQCLGAMGTKGAFENTIPRARRPAAGPGGQAKGHGILLGISSAAPMSEVVLSIYGNFAYGPGQFTNGSTAGSTSDTRYTVADFAL